jgi:molybdopterin-binding protein
MVLDCGRIVQQGPPEEVFRRPATPFIADFLGAENVFAGVANAASPTNDEPTAVEFRTGALTFYAVGEQIGNVTHAVLRAEEVVLSTEMPATSMRNHFAGCIVDVVFDGALAHVTVDVHGTPIVAAVTARSARELALAEGREVVVSFKATGLHLC